MSDELVIDYDELKATEDAIENAKDLINKANALELMITTTGWQILIESLEEKKNNQIEELINLPPGDDEAVLRAHAISFAVAHTVNDVSGAVHRAIQDGRNARIALEQLRLQTQPHEDEEHWS